MKKEIDYLVTSGSPENIKVSHFGAVKTFAEAKKVKRDALKFNPHQGGGYHIVKRTINYEVK